MINPSLPVWLILYHLENNLYNIISTLKLRFVVNCANHLNKGSVKGIT